MTVLGIETATSICAAAVSVDGAVVSEAIADGDHVHAERLLLLVEKAVGDAGIDFAGLSGIAVSIGPGSFTGLRIGLSTAKGLVYASGQPLAAVPTLEALARRIEVEGRVEASAIVVAALDARRDEIYCQLFAGKGGHLSPSGDACDLRVADLLRDLAGRDVLVTGNAWEKIHQGVAALPVGERPRIATVSKPLSRCSAGTVAMIGAELLARGRCEDPVLLEPRYIKEFFLKSRP